MQVKASQQPLASRLRSVAAVEWQRLYLNHDYDSSIGGRRAGKTPEMSGARMGGGGPWHASPLSAAPPAAAPYMSLHRAQGTAGTHQPNGG